MYPDSAALALSGFPAVWVAVQLALGHAMDEIIHNPFVVGLVKSLGVILASEIGDKTFFIAAIMAMRNPRLTVSKALLHVLSGISRADAGVWRDALV